MCFRLAVMLMSIASLAESQLVAEQLRDLIRVKTAPLKTLVFIYEGQYRLLNDRNAKARGSVHDQDFQGTFLYRSDGAALYDLYQIYPLRDGGVTRRKTSLLKGKIEKTRALIDARQPIKKDEIDATRGSLMYLDASEAPTDLYAVWSLGELYDNLFHEVVVEGFEMKDDRNCLRVRASVFAGPQDRDKERNKRVYWIDLERNAQVLLVERYEYGKLVASLDEIKLKDYRLKDGTSYWLPVHCRQRTFQPGEKTPADERTFSVVAGSEQLNINLPDSLFDVRRDLAYPTPKEIKGAEAPAVSETLARQFRSQTPAPPPEPYRTDPVSVRKRIEDGLAEAERQSKELEASSPARQAWSGTTVAQVAIGVVGVGLLGFVAVRQWRGR